MLYKINREDPDQSERIQIKTPFDFQILEEHIENFLRSRLSELVSEDELMLIGQERKGQEEADLLAIDKEGILYIFELKRWQSNHENILQVLRYGQIFGRYGYEDLEDLAQRQQKLEGSLKDKHQKYFQLQSPLSQESFNREQVFVLVTSGVDKDTISAVNYWSSKGLKIVCAPYRIYDIDDVPYIQFDTYNPSDEVLHEENTDYFIVNTNSSYMEDSWKEMINGGKASAYYDRKGAIARVKKGSTVYLYHTGQGVIARGTATSDFKKTDYDGDKDEEFYVPLSFDWALPDQSSWSQKAVKASDINQALNSGYRFRQTVFSISKSMADVINDIIASNNTE
jgi:hypothetical protein